jgi:hypothetical protein
VAPKTRDLNAEPTIGQARIAMTGDLDAGVARHHATDGFPWVDVSVRG